MTDSKQIAAQKRLVMTDSMQIAITCFTGTGAKEARDDEIPGRSPRYAHDDGFNADRRAKEDRGDESPQSFTS